MAEPGGSADESWWRKASVYQVYPRSFADSNGDGIGDLPGIIDHLDHIADLGFTAVWVSPFFSSPQGDFGYDISDYCDVAPEYGTLDDASRLIDEAHRRGLKVIFDLVLNHTSDLHPWFVNSRTSRDSEHADWYIWRDGRGPGGRLPPNNWRAALEVRSAWQRDPGRGQWYLASFLPWQPDLNWRNPSVRDAMWNAVRFWLDRGVDGFRLDMFGAIMKDEHFRDNPFRPAVGGTDFFRLWRRTYTDNTADNFRLARELRSLCDGYSPERVLIGEVFGTPEVLRNYLGDGDGLHLTFLFDFLAFRYGADFFRRRIAAYERTFPDPFLPTYVLENHDRARSLSRAGGDPRRARVLATLLLTLRGVPTVYQGQEIGMTNTYIPLAQAQDPVAARFFRWVPESISKRLPERINRDEVRTPMQWEGRPNAGFCPDDVEPWLPLNPAAPFVSVASQTGDPSSLLEWYRTLLRLRRGRGSLTCGALTLLPAPPPGVLGYRRKTPEESTTVLLNFSGETATVDLAGSTAAHASALAASDAGTGFLGTRATLAPQSALLLDG